MLVLEGRQLGNYDVIRRIRIGGMGAVYEGRQRTAFDRRVAIKVILGNYAADREMRRRFAREAQTVAQLRHPHILPLIEFGDERGILYLVMPFIEGGTLTSYLRRSLPELSDVAAIFLQLLDAVEYAHDEGLIHRDIKSSNVLLDFRRSGPPYVYLADFGLVRTSQQAELEQAGMPIPLDQVPGTPHYMAPEQTRGIVTTATDIYALGVLLYQMLVGELPYNDADEVKIIKMHLYAPIPSPCDRDASIPIELGEVVQTAMAKRAEARFRSIGEFRQAFLAAIDGPVATVNEDDLLLEEVIPVAGRRNSVPLMEPILLPAEPAETPPPMPMKRRQHAASAMPQYVRQRPKGFMRGRSRRFTLSVVGAMLVPVMLLALLIMPRVLGFSLFPSGFPVLGTSPVATVSVTVQSKTLQDTYILTASPQVNAPDPTSRLIPDRVVQSTSTNSRVTPTTGTKSVPGKQANGTILFDNSGHSSVFVNEGSIFTTNTNVQITLTQPVNVPGRHDGQDGTISASAMAVLPGASGNIPAYALTTTCCNDQLTVSNPQPFTSGVDPLVVHIVAQADLDGVKKALNAQLERQALQQISSQLRANEVKAGQPTYVTNVTSDSPAGTQVNQVKVQVSVSATVLVYNMSTASQVAEQLLSKQVTQTLGQSYQLKISPSIVKPIAVQQGKDGVIYLSVSVRGLWIYNLTPQQVSQWRQSIKGATPTLASTYLTSQPGVAAVQIQLPFGADHLPVSVDQIQIMFVNR